MLVTRGNLIHNPGVANAVCFLDDVEWDLNGILETGRLSESDEHSITVNYSFPELLLLPHPPGE
jgi:hypothetical protein